MRGARESCGVSLPLPGLSSSLLVSYVVSSVCWLCASYVCAGADAGSASMCMGKWMVNEWVKNENGGTENQLSIWYGTETVSSEGNIW